MITKGRGGREVLEENTKNLKEKKIGEGNPKRGKGRGGSYFKINKETGRGNNSLIYNLDDATVIRNISSDDADIVSQAR